MSGHLKEFCWCDQCKMEREIQNESPKKMVEDDLAAEMVSGAARDLKDSLIFSYAHRIKQYERQVEQLEGAIRAWMHDHKVACDQRDRVFRELVSKNRRLADLTAEVGVLQLLMGDIKELVNG